MNESLEANVEKKSKLQTSTIYKPHSLCINLFNFDAVNPHKTLSCCLGVLKDQSNMAIWNDVIIFSIRRHKTNTCAPLLFIL